MSFQKHPIYRYESSPFEVLSLKEYKPKKFNNWKKLFAKEMESKTLKYQRKYQFDTYSPDGSPTHNNQADAFKHTFMSAVLSLRLNERTSNLIGDFYELIGKNPAEETRMDLWNNQQGRNIAKEIKDNLKTGGYFVHNINQELLEDWIAEKIMQKMINGQLITSPDDSREIETYKKILDCSGRENQYIPSSRIYTIDELKKMSGKEMENDFKEIWAQYKSGMPTNAQADEQVALGNYEYVHPVDPKSETRNVSSAGKIWVEPYKRDDGTPVSGYYRSRPQYS